MSALPPGTEETPRGPWVVDGLPWIDGQNPREAARRWCEAQKAHGRRVITVQRSGANGGRPEEVKLAVALVWSVVG